MRQAGTKRNVEDLHRSVKVGGTCEESPRGRVACKAALWRQVPNGTGQRGGVDEALERSATCTV